MQGLGRWYGYCGERIWFGGGGGGLVCSLSWLLAFAAVTCWINSALVTFIWTLNYAIPLFLLRGPEVYKMSFWREASLAVWLWGHFVRNHEMNLKVSLCTFSPPNPSLSLQLALLEIQSPSQIANSPQCPTTWPSHSSLTILPPSITHDRKY